jgi:hypothetical protein
MFKRGGRLTTKSAATGAASGGGSGGSSSSRRKGDKGEQLDSITSRLERKVANCLSCGKIFDCRNVTSDVMRFIGKRSPSVLGDEAMHEVGSDD